MELVSGIAKSYSTSEIGPAIRYTRKRGRPSVTESTMYLPRGVPRLLKRLRPSCPLSSTLTSIVADNDNNDGMDTPPVLQQIATTSNTVDDEQPPRAVETTIWDTVPPVIEPTISSVFDTNTATNGRSQLCFHKWPMYSNKVVTFTEAAEIIVGLRDVDSSQMCHDTAPQGFKAEGTFVVNLENLTTPYDQDGMGDWNSGHSGERTRLFRYNSSGVPIRCDLSLPSSSAIDYDVKVLCKRYEHEATNNQFWRKIYVGIWPHRTGLQSQFSAAKPARPKLVVLSYEWKCEPFDFVVPPQLDGSLDEKRVNTVDIIPSTSRILWEAQSRNDVDRCADVVFDGCPLHSNGAVNFDEAARIIMGAARVSPSKICHSVPQGFRAGGCFVIDLRSIGGQRQLRDDSNGSWGQPSGTSRKYKVNFETGEATRVDRNHKLIAGAQFDLEILQKRYENVHALRRFVKKVYIGRRPRQRKNESCCDLAVVVYFWKGEPFKFQPFKQRKVLPCSTFAIQGDVSAKTINAVHTVSRNTDFAHQSSATSYNLLEDICNSEDNQEVVGQNEVYVQQHPQHAVETTISESSQQTKLNCAVHQADNDRMPTGKPTYRSTGSGAEESSQLQQDTSSTRRERVNPARMDEVRVLLMEKQFQVLERMTSVLSRVERVLTRIEASQTDQNATPPVVPSSAAGSSRFQVLVQDDQGRQYVPVQLQQSVISTHSLHDDATVHQGIGGDVQNSDYILYDHSSLEEGNNSHTLLQNI